MAIKPTCVKSLYNPQREIGTSGFINWMCKTAQLNIEVPFFPPLTWKGFHLAGLKMSSVMHEEVPPQGAWRGSISACVWGTDELVGYCLYSVSL